MPVITLSQVTGLDIHELSYAITAQLAVMIIIIPFILVALTGKGIKAIKGVFGITLVSELSFAIPQVFVAKFIGAELPAVVGSVVSMAVTVFLAKRFYNKPQDDKEESIPLKQCVMAWLPFILVFLFVMVC